MLDPLIGKTAYQSDYFGDIFSSVSAIDGNINQQMHSESCIATTAGGERWWSVDLGQTSVVHSLFVYPSLDCSKCTATQNA